MKNPDLQIDGSQGEGGGQIVRTSLALAAVTGRPLHLYNIRAGRRPAGLKPQHLAAARAAAAVCQGALRGDQVGSQQLWFEPGAVEHGDYTFDVGTAGSTTLVLQTVLPALLEARQSSRVELLGGTHNPLAPSLEFLQHCFLPALSKMGPQVQGQLLQVGFCPRGGGRLRFDIRPATLSPLQLLDRGQPGEPQATVILAKLPEHIADREIKVVTTRLGWSAQQCRVRTFDDSLSPGNALVLRLEFANITEVITSLGRPGLPAERVAGQGCRAAQQYLQQTAPVGEHLADQLLLPMGLAAWRGAGPSQIRVTELSAHTSTHIDVLRQILDLPIEVEAEGSQWLIAVG